MKYRLLRRKVIDLKLDAPLAWRPKGGGAEEPSLLAKLAVDLATASLDRWSR